MSFLRAEDPIHGLDSLYMQLQAHSNSHIFNVSRGELSYLGYTLYCRYKVTMKGHQQNCWKPSLGKRIVFVGTIALITTSFILINYCINVVILAEIYVAITVSHHDIVYTANTVDKL